MIHFFELIKRTHILCRLVFFRFLKYSRTIKSWIFIISVIIKVCRFTSISAFIWSSLASTGFLLWRAIINYHMKFYMLYLILILFKIFFLKFTHFLQASYTSKRTNYASLIFHHQLCNKARTQTNFFFNEIFDKIA